LSLQEKRKAERSSSQVKTKLPPRLSKGKEPHPGAGAVAALARSSAVAAPSPAPSGGDGDDNNTGSSSGNGDGKPKGKKIIVVVKDPAPYAMAAIGGASSGLVSFGRRAVRESGRGGGGFFRWRGRGGRGGVNANYAMVDRPVVANAPRRRVVYENTWHPVKLTCEK
jgi:hypothetical protein